MIRLTNTNIRNITKQYLGGKNGYKKPIWKTEKYA